MRPLSARHRHLCRGLDAHRLSSASLDGYISDALSVTTADNSVSSRGRSPVGWSLRSRLSIRAAILTKLSANSQNTLNSLSE